MYSSMRMEHFRNPHLNTKPLIHGLVRPKDSVPLFIDSYQLGPKETCGLDDVDVCLELASLDAAINCFFFFFFPDNGFPKCSQAHAIL